MTPSDAVLAVISLATTYAAGAANSRTPTRWRSAVGATTFFVGFVLGISLTFALLMAGG